MIRCADAVRALGKLAQLYLSRLSVQVAALTGSNGKTTTKELARHMLAKTEKVLASPASYNNAIGVPLTIFRLREHHRFLILEMGTSAPGEIRQLTRIASPHVAAITCIAQTHLEGLGSLENVASAKAEILEGLSPSGLVILNRDDPWCHKIGTACDARKLYFKLEQEADIFATNIEQTDQGTRFLLNGKYPCALPLLGAHNVYNLLAAAGICLGLGLELSEIPRRLEGFRPLPMRLERLQLDGVTFINDAYNANPKSMEAALEVLASFNGRGRRVFVCGEMRELGPASHALHRALGTRVAASSVNLLFALGEKGLEVLKGAVEAGFTYQATCHAPSAESLAEALRDALRPGDVVLLKASRGVHLERVLTMLKDHREDEMQPAGIPAANQ